MKLSARDAPAYFAKPDPSRAGLLIYGADAMRVALKRQEVIAALVGPDGEEEMRLTRLNGAELRKDPAALQDAVKAIGFFPGPRVAFVEDANEALVETLTAALSSWQPGDANIIVTARALKAASKLRKLFESHPNAFAAGIYDDPPSRAEIEQHLRQAGLALPSGDSLHALTALARALDPGDFRQVLEKLALYKFGDETPLTEEDIAACAPATIEAGLDEMLHCVAEAQVDLVGPLMRRLQSQGVTAVSLCIGLARHFRVLYTVASDPDGPGKGIGKLRPPVYGARRDRILRQAQSWGVQKLQTALSLILDTDLRLRSAGQTAPDLALVERALIRLAMLGRPR